MTTEHAVRAPGPTVEPDAPVVIPDAGTSDAPIPDAPIPDAPAATRSLIALATGDPFEELFEAVGVGLAMADADGRLMRVNAAYAGLLGRAAEDLVGVPLGELAHPEDAENWSQSVRALLDGRRQTVALETRQVRSDQSEAWVVLELRRVESADGSWYAVSIHDITDRRWAEQQLRSITSELRRRALHDPLTGLPNRVLALDHLRRAMARQSRDGAHVAALFCDLDGFKGVNDRRGHAAGDQLLRRVADALQASVRPSDLVARLSGDEFLVILAPACDREVDPVVQRLRGAVAKAGLEDGVTVSIGTALSAVDQTPEDLLADADAAMYRAKRAHHDTAAPRV